MHGVSSTITGSGLDGRTYHPQRGLEFRSKAFPAPDFSPDYMRPSLHTRSFSPLYFGGIWVSEWWNKECIRVCAYLYTLYYVLHSKLNSFENSRHNSWKSNYGVVCFFAFWLVYDCWWLISIFARACWNYGYVIYNNSQELYTSKRESIVLISGDYS